MPNDYRAYAGSEYDPTWRSVKLVYLLHIIGLLTALPIFIGALISHLKLNQGSPAARAHTSYQVRSFWYFVLFSVIGSVTVIIVGLGYVIMGLAWLWFLYRMIVGLLRAADTEPINA